MYMSDISNKSSSLGDSRETLGKTEKSLGKTEKSLGKTEKSLGKTEKSLGKTEKSLGKTEKSLGKTNRIDNKIVKTVGNVSTFVEKTVPESTKVSGKEVAESTKVSGKEVAESTKVSGKEVAGSTKVSGKKKRNQSPKQLANLKKGSIKLDTSKNVVETPKTGFTFPVKTIIIMAFIAGGTLGFLGLWKWWQNQKKSKENEINQDLLEYNGDIDISPNDLAMLEANNQ